jgi:hypothetical protein
MTTHTPSTASTPTQNRPITEALVQNDAVKESVEQSAHELLVLTAVMQKNIPDSAQQGDLAQALQKTEDLGDAIQESAEELEAVNLLLEREVDERIALERELLATKASLKKAQASA